MEYLRSRMVIAFLPMVLLVNLFSLPTFADDKKPYYYIPDVPEDMSQVDFYLMTVGDGDDLAARYGHTGIRVLNHVDGTDVVFNWGRFYFDDPMFAVRFYQGDLTYGMAIRSYRREIEHQEADQRSLVQEKINLNVRQKKKLLEKIAFNARPENRDFKYQYWFKNCSTIPRDYLDEVLEGQVRAKYYRDPAGKTFRDYVRSNLAEVPMMIPVLDTIMNSRIDRGISKWEEMFKPAMLRKHLLEMNAVDADGNPIVGQPLLSESKTLLEYPEHYRDYRLDYAFLGIFFTILLAALFLRFNDRTNDPKKAASKYRFLGFQLLLFGLISGFFGTAMAMNWMFSGHPDIWHDANLLLFIPFDVIFVVIGFRLIRTAQPVKDRFPFPRAGLSLVFAHVACFLLLVLGSLLGYIEQNVVLTTTFFGIPMLLLLFAYLKYGILFFAGDGVTEAVRVTKAGEKILETVALKPLPTPGKPRK